MSLSQCDEPDRHERLPPERDFADPAADPCALEHLAETALIDGHVGYKNCCVAAGEVNVWYAACRPPRQAILPGFADTYVHYLDLMITAMESAAEERELHLLSAASPTSARRRGGRLLRRAAESSTTTAAAFAIRHLPGGEVRLRAAQARRMRLITAK